MKTKISQGQEKYIIKICELAKQEERVRVLRLIDDWNKYVLKVNNSNIDDDLVEELKSKITGQRVQDK